MAGIIQFLQNFSYAFENIAPFLIVTVIAAVLILLVIPLTIGVIIAYFIYATTYTKLTKDRTDLKTWLVWIPIVNVPAMIYFMQELSNMEDFRLFGDSIVLKKKTAFKTFLILWIVALVFIGAKVPLIPTLLLVALFFMEFVYIRNLFNYYNPEEPDKNRKKAVLAVVLNFFTYALAKPIIIARFVKKHIK